MQLSTIMCSAWTSDQTSIHTRSFTRPTIQSMTWFRFMIQRIRMLIMICSLRRSGSLSSGSNLKNSGAHIGAACLAYQSGSFGGISSCGLSTQVSRIHSRLTPTPPCIRTSLLRWSCRRTGCLIGYGRQSSSIMTCLLSKDT